MTMTHSIRRLPTLKPSPKPLNPLIPRSLMALAAVTALITLFALGACSTVPRDNARLDEARSSAATSTGSRTQRR